MTGKIYDKNLAHWVPGDLVHGDIIDEFVSSVIRALEHSNPEAEPGGQRVLASDVPVPSQVYVYHGDQDRSYALSVAKALRKREVFPIMPAIDDDPVKREKLHRSYLMENDFVVLCWANATDTWRKTASHELKHWNSSAVPDNSSVAGLSLDRLVISSSRNWRSYRRRRVKLTWCSI